ncbi:MAG: V-type ATP synthase subunit A, partial [Candidatus Nitrosotenuis sp.]
FDDVDTYCSPQKQFKVLTLLVDFYRRGQAALRDGASLSDIRAMPVIATLLKARMEVKENELAKLDSLSNTIESEFKNISGVKVSA